jgi:hypothetical protein
MEGEGDIQPPGQFSDKLPVTMTMEGEGDIQPVREFRKNSNKIN